MFQRTPIFALLLFALCLAPAAQATKLPRHICKLAVDAEAGEEWQRQSVLARYHQLRKYLTPRSPDISPLQFWIISVLADHPSQGLTVKELQEEFQRRGFAYAEGNLQDSVDRMANRRRYVKSRLRDQDMEFRYAATAEGLWEVVNLIGFYGKVRQIADKERRTCEAPPIAYVTDPTVVPPFPVLGHTQTVILAALAPNSEYWLQDFGYEVITLNLGTPGAASDVYAATSEMAVNGLVRRVRAPGRPISRREVSAEENLRLSSTRGGEVAVAQSLQFYEYSYQCIRADESMLIQRLLIEAATDG